MIQFVYFASEDRLFGRDTSLAHAWDAATQRKNYNSGKRHDRYIRDRDAGKTGYKGIEAQTQNPNGDYANPYYNPQRAQRYYQETFKKDRPAGRSSDSKKNSMGMVDSGSSGSSGAEDETPKERELRESRERQKARITESTNRQKTNIDAITARQKSEIDAIQNAQKEALASLTEKRKQDIQKSSDEQKSTLEAERAGYTQRNHTTRDIQKQSLSQYSACL